MDWTRDKNKSLRDELEYIASHPDIEPDERLARDKELTIPVSLKRAFEAFRMLSSTRNDLVPISFSEIKAFTQLCEFQLSAYEVIGVNTIDQSYIVAAIKVQNEVAAK